MDQTASAFTGIFGTVIIVFLFVVAVLGFLMPIFVYQIKNEIIKSNKKMDESIKFLREIEWHLQRGKEEQPKNHGQFQLGDKKYKKCPKCHTENSEVELQCMHCGANLL